jgi:TP901 family phage tail tape measure protein
MAKTKEDRSRVTLEVDGKQAINQLGKLEMESKQLAVDLKNLKRGTKEYIETTKRLRESKAQVEALRKEIGLTGMTMTQLTRYQRDLKKEIGNTATYGTEKHRELQRSYQEVTAEINRQRKELNGTATAVDGVNTNLKKTPGFFADIKREIKTFTVLAVGALGVTELFAGIQNLISGSAELADAYADVQKTTGLTRTEVEELAKELKTMDTRTARSELLKLSAEAGKLGISARKDVLEFVEGADKINVSLGEDLGEGAITSIGKLNELFGYREIYGYGDAMLKAGSAINELGAKSTAQESYIVGFTARLGGAAKQAKITMTDIMGLAATLDSLGQQEETSSTAIGMFLVDMFKDTSTYAGIARMSLQEFTDLLNTDANEALIKVLEGLNNNNEGFTTMVTKLQEAGVEGSRGTQVISALAGNVKLLREQQAIANEAFTSGTSILEEFNKKNENFAGNLEKVQKWMASLFVNTTVMDGLNTFVGKWAEWIKIPISEKMEDERMALNKLYTQILTTNVGSADRIKLVNELKEMHPAILGNLNAETVTNQELARSIRLVNDQLVNKIILQKQDEEIEKRNNAIAEKKMQLFEQEDKVREQMIKLAEKYNIEIKAANSLEEQAIQVYTEARAIQEKTTQTRGRLFDTITEYSNQIGQMQSIQRSVNGLEEGGNKLLEKKNELLTRMGIIIQDNILASTQPNRAALLAGGGQQNEGTPPINLGGAAPTNVPSFNAAAEEIIYSTAEALKGAGKENPFDTMEAHFEKMKELHEQFGLDITAQERARDEMRSANAKLFRDKEIRDEQAMADAKMMIAQGLSTALGAAIDLVGDRQGELTAFQKALAVAQIAIDTAAAMGKVLPLALATSAKDGPLAAFTLAGYIASMTASVLSAAARAKQVLSDAQVPDWQGEGDRPDTGRSRPPSTQPKKSFYFGGWTGEENDGSQFGGDRYGAFKGWVHANEYVMPSSVVQDPFIANLLPAIEAIRQDRVNGFSGGSTGKGMGMMSDPETKEILRGILKEQQATKNKRVILVTTDLEEHNEERVYLQDRYRA